jgi:stress-induced-phosphoprotein 1
MPEALKDAEKTIELAPEFVRGYERKGTVQFFMKKYEDAVQTYQDGLKVEPNNQELLDGIKRWGAQSTIKRMSI